MTHYYGIYGWDGKNWVTYNNNNGSELIAPTQGFFVAAKSKWKHQLYV